MAGNGYFDASDGTYKAKSVETWDDFQGTSAGDDWDSLTSWNLTQNLPLTFTTGILDYGKSDILNYVVSVDASVPANITVAYGDTVDSAGGSIDSPSTVSTTPSQTGLLGKNGRYWQFTVSLPEPDSAGVASEVVLRSVGGELRGERIQQTITDVNSNTLSGSTGVRQVELGSEFGAVTSIITQPHLPSGDAYVADSYVASDYFEAGITTATPYIFVDKSTDPITLYIYDIDAYGKRRAVDCTFDAVATGNRALETDTTGSIREVN